MADRPERCLSTSSLFDARCEQESGHEGEHRAALDGGFDCYWPRSELEALRIRHERLLTAARAVCDRWPASEGQPDRLAELRALVGGEDRG